MPATKDGEVLTPLWELLFSFDSMFTSLYFDCFRDTGTPKPSLQIFLLFCLDRRWKSYYCSVMTPACLNCMSTAFCLYVASLPQCMSTACLYIAGLPLRRQHTPSVIITVFLTLLIIIFVIVIIHPLFPWCPNISLFM
jgi:hypothetical protein